ncbi:MAG TPA: hypothetical protein VM012_07710 [Flavitalea sp.]|nr:hypothetical protein [Flavitalea sp.]
MKIALFDTGHFETAYTLIRLFDIPGNQVIIFTNSRTESILKEMLDDDQDRYEWYIIDRWISDWNYFRYVKRQLAVLRPALIFLNTIDRLPFYYALMLNFLPQARVIVTIHDINCFFERGHTNAISQALRWYSKKFLIREAEALNVLSDTMVPYLRKKTDNRISVLQIPGAVFENRISTVVNNRRISLVVPGSIDQRRRNYDDVFLLNELLEEAGLPIDITLLGGHSTNYGRAVIAKAKQWNGRHTSIVCYDTEIVLQSEYENVIQSAHFLFCPITVHTKMCGDIPEIYGITKSSGSLADAVRHAKPIIVPDELKTSPRLDGSVFKYKNMVEITDLLFKIYQDGILYKEWEENAISNSAWYTIEHVRERNGTVFFGEEEME